MENKIAEFLLFFNIPFSDLEFGNLKSNVAYFQFYSPVLKETFGINIQDKKIKVHQTIYKKFIQ